MPNSPVIVPMTPPAEPSGPNMAEKTTLDVVRDTALARISTTGAHVLTGMAMRYAAEQEAVAASINPEQSQLLTGRCGQYMAQFDLVVSSAYRRMARPLKLESKRR